jgi:hypothetical protein
MDLRHPGCDELSSPLAIHTAMAKGEKGGTVHLIHSFGDGQPMLSTPPNPATSFSSMGPYLRATGS